MLLLPVITLFLLSAVARAKEVYYLDVNSQGAAISVSLNGFPLWEVMSPDGQAFSAFVSPYLLMGKNELEINYRIPENKTGKLALPWVDCQIIKAPADHQRTTEAPGETVLKKRYDPVERRKLSDLAPEDYTLLSGSVPEGGGLFYFGNAGERRWAFGIRLNEGVEALFDPPRSLELAGVTDSLVLAEVHFRKSRTGEHLAYKALKFLRGGERVTLSPENLTQGVGVLDDRGFDTLWILGFAAEGVSEVRALDIRLFDTPRPVSETVEFQVGSAEAWGWGKAVEIASLPGERESLVAFLKTLHQTIDKEPAENWLPFFESKVRDLALAMGRPAGEMETAQEEYFKNLRNVEGWSLEPFDPSRLTFTPVNSRIVAVSYVDSEGPILSVPLVRPGQDQPDRFKIPLYLAKVEGAWTVVR